MKFVPTEIAEVIVIEPRVLGDHRGYFVETWHAGRFADAGLDLKFVQDNESRSARNVLRGLHYQVQQPQGKLVRVVEGEILDVAVDLRRSSSTFGRWTGATLSAANHRQMWVPPGFAHGFCVLSDHATVIYKCTDFYAPEHERSLLWNDAEVGVRWPIGEEVAVLSARDRAGRRLADAETYP
jgi:dTDP-4-dehydrorhamnose 3,5-epimerase